MNATTLQSASVPGHRRSRSIRVVAFNEFMTPEQQRIAIAEACGWKLDGECVWFPSGTKTNRFQSSFDGGGTDDLLFRIIPDYLNDLNAMHSAEKVLQQDIALRNRYADELRCIDMPPTEFFYLHATAAQRAEAFLRTIGKWKD